MDDLSRGVIINKRPDPSVFYQCFLTPMFLLLVDDEEELLELATGSLQALGYNVLTATNGQQALEIISKVPDIALLFSDVVMPGGINGYELAERAISINPNQKVLLTSGFTENAVEIQKGQTRLKNIFLLNNEH